MKRFIFGLAVCLATLGIAGAASAHPPHWIYERPIITPAPVILQPAPIIVTPAPVVVAPAPVVVSPVVEIVRPVYPIHGIWRR